MSTLIIYEVNIEVGEPIQREFLSWLTDHIQQMEKLPGFLPKTEVLKLESEQGLDLSIRYHLQSMIAMEGYFAENAERMRGDLPENFKSHLKFSRRVLQPYKL